MKVQMDPKELREKCEYVSSLMKVLSHSQRLMMLCCLKEGEMTVSQIQERCDISQPQISAYLNRMQRERLLKSRKEGSFSYYYIADEQLIDLLNSMQRIFC